ncbi:MAG: glycine cleavage system protein GcvH [bacterium]|nr:glycine cleavage system protein GcvH [bacterium]
MTDLIPNHLKYTKEHEWAEINDNVVTIGISHHAQKQLGDVVYLELPEAGKTVSKNKVFGTIESVKAVSDLYSPVSGTVTEVNTNLVDEPEIVNQDPYKKGWMIKVKMDNNQDLNDTMDNNGYKMYLEQHIK